MSTPKERFREAFARAIQIRTGFSSSAESFVDQGEAWLVAADAAEEAGESSAARSAAAKAARAFRQAWYRIDSLHHHPGAGNLSLQKAAQLAAARWLLVDDFHALEADGRRELWRLREMTKWKQSRAAAHRQSSELSFFEALGRAARRYDYRPEHPVRRG